MDTFRTIENSGAQSALEGLQFVTVKSRALAGRADITFFVPPQAHNARHVPLVILLHGVYGSHWAWALKGGAHQTLGRMVAGDEVPPMVLAMPSDGLWGDGSGYIPHGKQDFERWIVEEVPAAAADQISSVSAESPLFISGLSMGGFGALRLAAKYPERFKAVSGHSSITHFDQMRLFVEESLASYHAFPEDHSVLETMLRNRERLPAIRFDCGTADQLIEHNRELHQQLLSHGIRHQYEEFPGGHEWSYWSTHAADTFRFFGTILRAGNV
jgi:putative tributyrin esterase